MLAKLSKKMTLFFIKKKVIEENKREIYDYCFEILLSTIINMSAIIIIAIATRTYLELFLYVFSFMVLRATAGGYHAKTHIGCFLILMFFYLGFLLMVKLMPIITLRYFSIAYSIISLILVFLLAPIESFNNPLSDNEKRKLSRQSIIATIAVIIVSVILHIFVPTMSLGFCLMSGMLSVNFVTIRQVQFDYEFNR